MSGVIDGGERLLDQVTEAFRRSTAAPRLSQA
jgi:hypothetical protein